MDENISRAAGASHGQELDESELRAIVEPLGRTLEQRTTLYGRTHTEGKRLRPPAEVVADEAAAEAYWATATEGRPPAEATGEAPATESVPVTLGATRS
jgi:hypothetical protein